MSNFNFARLDRDDVITDRPVYSPILRWDLILFNYPKSVTVAWVGRETSIYLFITLYSCFYSVVILSVCIHL